MSSINHGKLTKRDIIVELIDVANWKSKTSKLLTTLLGSEYWIVLSGWPEQGSQNSILSFHIIAPFESELISCDKIHYTSSLIIHAQNHFAAESIRFVVFRLDIIPSSARLFNIPNRRQMPLSRRYNLPSSSPFSLQSQIAARRPSNHASLVEL